MTESIPRAEFCASIGGIYDDNGATCTLQRRSDGVQPSCFKAAASNIFYDELGPCYDFQRLDNSVYRQRYRLTDKCYSQMDTFKRIVIDPDTGICANVNEWMGARGVFIPSQFPVVTSAKEQDPRDCRVHRSKSRCEAGLCSWSDAPTFIQCIDDDDGACASMCTSMGGDIVDGECVVPECRPTQMSESACD